MNSTSLKKNLKKSGCHFSSLSFRRQKSMNVNNKGVLRTLVCFAGIYLSLYFNISFKGNLSNKAWEPQALTIRARHFNQTQHGFIYCTWKTPKIRHIRTAAFLNSKLLLHIKIQKLLPLSQSSGKCETLCIHTILSGSSHYRWTQATKNFALEITLVTVLIYPGTSSLQLFFSLKTEHLDL